MVPNVTAAPGPAPTLGPLPHEPVEEDDPCPAPAPEPAAAAAILPPAPALAPDGEPHAGLDPVPSTGDLGPGLEHGPVPGTPARVPDADGDSSDDPSGVSLRCRYCPFIGKRKSEVALHEKLHGQRVPDVMVPCPPQASPHRVRHQPYPVPLPAGYGGRGTGLGGAQPHSLKRSLPWEYYDVAGGPHWPGDGLTSASGTSDSGSSCDGSEEDDIEACDAAWAGGAGREAGASLARGLDLGLHPGRPSNRSEAVCGALPACRLCGAQFPSRRLVARHEHAHFVAPKYPRCVPSQRPANWCPSPPPPRPLSRTSSPPLGPFA